MRDLKREEIPTEHKCEKCDSPMVIKWGRNGEFLACSGYPECKNTKRVHATRRRHDRDRARAHHRREVRDLRGAHAGQARPLRRVPRLLALPRVQDHRPISLGVTCPRPELRRVPHREALAARQGLLRLLQLLQDPVRLRAVGPPGPARSARSAAPPSWSSARTGAAAAASAASPTAAAIHRSYRRPAPVAKRAKARPPPTLPEVRLAPTLPDILY